MRSVQSGGNVIRRDPARGEAIAQVGAPQLVVMALPAGSDGAAGIKGIDVAFDRKRTGLGSDVDIPNMPFSRRTGGVIRHKEEMEAGR